MDFSFIKLPKGIEMREPFEGEVAYFRANPNVSGMATEDNKVILNPFSPLKPHEFQSVATNESARIIMRRVGANPDFELTDQQKTMLDTTTYRNAPEDDRKATIAARILTGDRSAGVPTPEQVAYVHRLRSMLQDE